VTSAMLKVLMFSAEVACSDPFDGVDVCVVSGFYPLSYNVKNLAIPYVQYELFFFINSASEGPCHGSGV
jgi:hypothetical protein